MAPRANWKGYLKLSLVSCAVALYPATNTSGRVRFNIINRRTGHRVHNQVVDAETGEPVDPEDRVKGYKAEGGKYTLIEEEDLDRVALESTHTIDIEGFVPRDEIDEIYLDESHYIVPDDKVANEAFAVIREAMEKQDLVGIARVVLYRRERILMLQPRGKGLLATTLRYNNEVRDESAYFDDIPNTKITGDMLDLAIHILSSKKQHFDPSKFEDRYEKALTQMLKAKRAGKELPPAPEPPPSNVVSLMDALRRSVATEKSGTGKKAPAKRRERRTASPGSKSPARSRRLKKAS
jgi:DNA end-binding protein Ku